MIEKRGKRKSFQRTKRKPGGNMSGEDVCMDIPSDDTNTNKGSTTMIRRLFQSKVARLLLKPVDSVITLLFFIQLRTYGFCAGRLPNLKLLTNRNQRSVTNDEIALKEDRIQKLEARLREYGQINKGLEDDLKAFKEYNQKMMTDYDGSIRQMQEKVKIAEEEKDTALRRLSEVISVKLRDNNPNIVDLNDQCRPTKLAEKFSELYDNEWTDAYDVMSSEFTERQTIVILLDLVMESYEYCSVVVTGTWNYLEQWYLNNNEQASDEQQKVTKWLKDNRKSVIKRKVPEITERFMAVMLNICEDNMVEQLLKNDVVLQYINKCIELCLLMVANDPPVVLVCPDWKPCRLLENGPTTLSQNGQNGMDLSAEETTLPETAVDFNKQLYKEYTTRGEYQEYIVWPLMLLHQDGSTLSKGVAQGTNNIDTSWDGFSWRKSKQ